MTSGTHLDRIIEGFQRLCLTCRQMNQNTFSKCRNIRSEGLSGTFLFQFQARDCHIRTYQARSLARTLYMGECDNVELIRTTKWVPTETIVRTENAKSNYKPSFLTPPRVPE